MGRSSHGEEPGDVGTGARRDKNQQGWLPSEGGLPMGAWGIHLQLGEAGKQWAREGEGRGRGEGMMVSSKAG